MTSCAQTKKNAVELDSVGDHEGQQYLIAQECRVRRGSSLFELSPAWKD